MKNRSKCLFMFLLLLLVMNGSGVYAADEAVPNAPVRWSGTATIGPMAWSDLKALKPAVGGGFDSLGFAMELAGHKRVSRWGSADVLVGAGFGLFATWSDIPGISGDLIQRGLYLTPSMQIRFGERSGRYLNLGAGLGWYQVDFAELHCDEAYFNNNNGDCIEITEPYDESSLGGYLGITGGFRSGFIMGLKVHFADFGTVTGLGPDTGDLKGPIYVLSLGVDFGD